MKTLTLQIPDSLDEKEVITLLANYDVSVFNYTEAELTKDIL